MKPRVPSAALEGLLLATLAFGPFAFGGVEPWARAILESLCFALALAVFLRGRVAASRAGAWAWLFPAGVALLGVLQSLRPARPDGPWLFGPMTVAPHETIAAALLWAAYAALLYSVPRVVISSAAARRFVWTIFGIGLGVAALGVLQALTSKDLIYWTRETARDLALFGPYYDRDHAADLMLMSLALGSGVLVSQLRRWNPTDGLLPGQLRAAASSAGGCAFLFLAIVFCRSRGTLLAMPLAASVLGLAGAGHSRKVKQRAVGALASLAGLSLVVLLAFSHVESGERAGAPMDRSVSGRLSIYADSSRWVRDAPLFGTGLGTFSTVYPAYQDESLRFGVAHAHSDWLEFLLETGAPGELAALAALAALFAAGALAWRRAKSREMRPLIAGALAAVAGCAAHALFEFNLQIPANALLFFALGGFLLSAASWADKAPHEKRSEPPQALPALAALASFLMGTWMAASPAVAAWSVDREGAFDGHVAALRAALQTDDDPVYWRDLARATCDAALSGPGEPAAFRRCLFYAAQALPRIPFDAANLSAMGAALWSLGRETDAKELIARRDLVSFSPYWNGPSREDWDRRRLRRLQELRLLPTGVTAR